MKPQRRFPIAHYSFALQQIVSERLLFASKIGAQTFSRLGFGPQKEWNHVGCTRTHMGATLWFQYPCLTSSSRSSNWSPRIGFERNDPMMGLGSYTP